MISNHCIEHRLVVACAQAANEVPYVKSFKNISDQLFRFLKTQQLDMQEFVHRRILMVHTINLCAS